MKFMWITSIWQKRADRMLYCCNLQPGMLQIKCYVCFAHSLIRPCPKSEQVASLLVRKSLIIGGTIQPTWWDVVSFVCLFVWFFLGGGGGGGRGYMQSVSGIWISHLSIPGIAAHDICDITCLCTCFSLCLK